MLTESDAYYEFKGREFIDILQKAAKRLAQEHMKWMEKFDAVGYTEKAIMQLEKSERYADVSNALTILSSTLTFYER